MVDYRGLFTDGPILMHGLTPDSMLNAEYKASKSEAAVS